MSAKRTTLEERLSGFLRGLTPDKQAKLLREIELGTFIDRDIPSLKYVERELRLLLRSSKYQQDRLAPDRLFFRSLEPILVTGVADRKKGQISRASLKAIWAWISRDLLPAATQEYCSAITTAAKISDVAACERAARIFQEQALLYIRHVLADVDRAEEALARLKVYTAPPDILDDLNVIVATLSASTSESSVRRSRSET